MIYLLTFSYFHLKVNNPLKLLLLNYLRLALSKFNFTCIFILKPINNIIKLKFVIRKKSQTHRESWIMKLNCDFWWNWFLSAFPCYIIIIRWINFKIIYFKRNELQFYVWMFSLLNQTRIFPIILYLTQFIFFFCSIEGKEEIVNIIIFITVWFELCFLNTREKWWIHIHNSIAQATAEVELKVYKERKGKFKTFKYFFPRKDS